jgi:hypothetical protein
LANIDVVDQEVEGWPGSRRLRRQRSGICTRQVWL